MYLTQEEVDEFKKMWKDEFNEEIDEAYARKRAEELIELYAMIYGPESVGQSASSSEMAKKVRTRGNGVTSSTNRRLVRDINPPEPKRIQYREGFDP